MKKLLFFLTLILAYGFAYPQITFERTYGGFFNKCGYCVQQTSDTGYIAVGSASNFEGNCNVYLVKTDKYGNTVWQKNYWGIGEDLGYSVKQTMDGGYIITGAKYEVGAVFGDIYLIRTDNNGDTLWTKTYGHYNDFSWGYSVIENTDGSFIIAGAILDTVLCRRAGYIVKTDANGDTIWTKVYEEYNESYFNDIKKMANGYFLVSGSNQNYAGRDCAYLLKLKENGDTVWTKTIIDPNSKLFGGMISMYDTSGFIFDGYITYSSWEDDLYLMKTDTNGNLIWFKTYGGVGRQNLARSCQAFDGGIVLTGNVKDSTDSHYTYIYLVKTDNDGDTLWSRKLGGSDNNAAYCVQTTNDNGIIICGRKIVGSETDLYLIKTDENGQFTGIEDHTTSVNNRITVYPNPVTGKAHIQIPPQFGTKTLEVYDCMGQLKLTKTENFSSIDLSSLAGGLYFIVLTNADNEKITSKIIKE